MRRAESFIMFLLTGTPGVGKSTIADLLEERGYEITRAKDTVQKYIINKSDDDSEIDIDIDAWASHFKDRESIVEGHFSHFIPGAEGVIVLRCNPEILTERLRARGYREEKVRENGEAEALDVILIETFDLYPADQIYEIDASDTSPEEVVDQVERILLGQVSPCCGIVDWTWWL